ncbi:TPA: relaxase/mobilization nuclease domain-containing protein [Klebsiella pneumoniae]|nr:relaxase/mobilization nuclease domain-containing protein [Klebsiella pneumoniae]HBV2321202.1 relaxase/mobilization nuclease domain-containing protein [Klebsiella pneumoniae]HBV2336640.1 relaxase/mobilization nuclease domain-containing protein [Klebsiella pneumoniae]HBV2347381.1 relaxase/mobilization nuclease domain-containing protein [Klebsiella pneumoniae]
MKGMQRIKRHKNFINVVKYVLKPGSHHRSDPVVIGGNMTGDCANELIAEFDTASRLRTDIAKPAWHNSLRLPQGDKLSNEQWKSIADDYMHRMGFNDTHLRCYVLHDDSAGQHIHIIANRIDSVSGRVNLGRHESLRSGRIIQELEIRYDLTITKGPVPLKPENTGKEKNNVIPTKAKKLSRNETMYEKRTGEVCNKKQLQVILDKSLADTPDLLTFIKRLEGAEVSWTANVASTGKMNGFSFSYRDIAFKASQLGKGYSWANLQKQLSYNPDHLEALRKGIQTKEVPAPAPAPATVLKTTERKESIVGKIAELELRLREDKRNEIVGKILQKNAVQRQKHSRLSGWIPFLRRFIELLRSYGKNILHQVPPNFSVVYSSHHLKSSRKIRL